MDHLHPSHSSDEEDVVFEGSGGPLAAETTASEPLAHCTHPNSYGIYRVYPGGEASYSPDELYSLDSVTEDSVAVAKDSEEYSCPWWTAAPSFSSDTMNYYAPFPTASHFRLMQWFYDGSTSKTLSALDNLIQDVLLSSDFKTEELVGFRAAHEAERLDQSHHTQSRFSADDGWIKSSVEIFLPAEGVKHASESLMPRFEVPGLLHC